MDRDSINRIINPKMTASTNASTRDYTVELGAVNDAYEPENICMLTYSEFAK